MLTKRLRYWIESAGRSESLREEMNFHLAEKAAELRADGMTAERAQSEARRLFGNVGLKSEESREIWMTRFLSELCQDFRYGCRNMAANKVFSAFAIFLLALGIGANTAVYSFMESILLRSLPVSDPESLVVLNWHSPPPFNASKQWSHVMHGLQGLMWPGNGGTMVSGIFPYPAFERLRADNPVLSTLFAYFNGLNRNLFIHGRATTGNATFVSGQYFRGLGVPPAEGRLIDSEDDRAGAAAVAVISFAISDSHFGGSRNAIGQSILVDNVSFTVIGVTPPKFFGVDPAAAPAVYLPLHATVLVDGPNAARMYQDQNSYWIEIMGRLRSGVSMAQAQAALARRFHQWVATTATTDGERARLPALTLDPGAAGLGTLRRRYSKPLYVLLTMVALILGIACANIATLLLARSAARQSEMAVRLSLGAGRLRLVRQLLTESVILASAGGAAAILLAFWGMRWLTFLLSRGQENFTVHAALNWNVLGVTAALSMACGVLTGLAPAIQSTRPDVTPLLKKARVGGSRHRAQHILVVGQVALSFLLLVAAGLFVRTLNQLHSIHLGYTRKNILLFSCNARAVGHREPEISAFYENIRKRLEAIPGVSSATLSQSSIVRAGMAGGSYRGAIKIDTATARGAGVMVVGPHYLSTMQIPILAGREIDEHDQAGSAPVAVISKQLARTYFGDENPLGRRITFVDDNRDLQVVGLSGNVRYGDLKEDDSHMTVFVAARQFHPERVTFALRTASNPLGYVNSVYEIVREVDSRMPVTNVLTQAAEIDSTVSQEITFARLCLGFAVLALLIACVGIYGTMSYGVERQGGEIGIRMALGAQRRAIVWMVLRRALLLVGIGLAIGVPAALSASRLIKSFLFETQPDDSAALVLAGVVLVSAAILACYGPAARASRIDPVAALRQE